MIYFRVFFFLFSFSLTTAYQIWPRPTNASSQSKFYSIDPKNFTIQIKTIEKCEILDKAVKRYQESRIFIQDCSRLNKEFNGHYLIDTVEDFKHNKYYVNQLDKITIQVDEKCESIPNVHMDESYRIKIQPDSNSIIHSKTVWGALRGLETFSQMIVRTGKDQFKIHLGQVEDSPRYSYRGFLVDTSRHFLPLHSIYEMLDAMEMNKFNVFHWHIVDDQSFPFVSEKFPNLSKKGAFRPDYIYNVKNVKDVIEYATERGIRVIPEFDTPGHTESWKGQKDLLTQCYDDKGKPSNSFGPINPSLNSTYEFMQDFFEEIAHRFSDQYFHLGGDEVDVSCWKSNPDLQKFMKEKKLDAKELQGYYMEKLMSIVHNLNRSYVVWQEVFDDVSIRPDTIVHVWKGTFPDWRSEMKKVTSAGYKTIFSSCWYLNYIKYGSDWRTYYECEPTDFHNATAKEKSMIIGGEACMWGEYVDSSNIISRSWPRACAVAERLWSHHTDVKKAIPRFHTQRCRMQLQGLRVEPNEGPQFCWCDNAL